MAQTAPALASTNSEATGALLFAAGRGDVHAISQLVNQKRVNIAEGDYDGRTALHLAASEGQVEAVRFLISLGAPVNATDRYGNTPLDDALRSRHNAVAASLKENGGVHGNNKKLEQDLISAAKDGSMDDVERLIRAGVPVNCADYDGRTPLHLAVSEGHLDMIDYLLQQGANINAVDRFGGTPLTDAIRLSARVGKDEVRERLEKHGAQSRPGQGKSYFVPIFAFFQFVFIILWGVFVRYPQGLFNESGDEDVDRLYPMYQDVHVMIYVGFGFLMTFLRKYGYSSIGYNFLIAAFVFQWYILCGGFWHKAFNGGWYEMIHVDIYHMILADFCGASVLITYGALLGKTTPTQMLLIAFIETIFFSLNEAICLYLGVADVGGSMVIHTFGAYFGLSASIFLTPKQARGRSDNAANYRSDLFAMIGTIFLWMYWPSFNAAPSTPDSTHRTIVNTVISLSGSCVSAFVASRLFRGEDIFNMVDIQNATLAGGVAVGSVANMVINPYGALIIGCCAGTISVLGYVYIQPFLEKYLNLYDTCGVNNLHGIPGILSGVSSAIVAGAAKVSLYHGEEHLRAIFPGLDSWGRSAQEQAGVQIAFLGITFGIAIATGAATGYALRYVEPATKYFSDAEFWEVPHLETPYYFDLRGEIGREGDKNKKKHDAKDANHAASVHDVELQPLIPLQSSSQLIPQSPAAPADYQMHLLLNKMDILLQALAEKKQ